MEKQKTQHIQIRVTPEEKKLVQKLATQNGYKTLTAFLLNGATNHVTVEIDTSDYRDLVIQVRRIGTNINQLIRSINYSKYFTNEQIFQIEIYLKNLDNYLKEEDKKVNSVEKKLQKISKKDLKKILQDQKKEVPDYLIFDNIIDEINIKLLSFIDLLDKEGWNVIFIDFVYSVLEEIIPENFTYEELIQYSNDLDKALYKINQKMLNPNNNFTDEDFDKVRDVLLNYKKENMLKGNN